MGVFLMLTQPCRVGVAGALLADEMGLGKTLQILMAILIRGYLIEMHYDMYEKPDQHLPTDHSRGAKCPSRHRYGGIQCPCEKGSWASKIVKYLFDLPTVVFMPPSLIDNWVDQVNTHIDLSDSSLAKAFQFKVVHSEWCNANKKDPVRKAFVCSPDEIVTTDPDKRDLLDEIDGGCKLCYFASCNIQRSGKFPDNFPVGLIVMDEVHRYRGSTARTGPFTFLYTKSRKMLTPVFLHLVSGSLQSLGPDAWRWAVEHFQHTAKEYTWKHYKSVVSD